MVTVAAGRWRGARTWNSSPLQGILDSTYQLGVDKRLILSKVRWATGSKPGDNYTSIQLPAHLQFRYVNYTGLQTLASLHPFLLLLEVGLKDLMALWSSGRHLAPVSGGPWFKSWLSRSTLSPWDWFCTCISSPQSCVKGQGSYRLWNCGKTMEFWKGNSIYGKTMEFK